MSAGAFFLFASVVLALAVIAVVNRRALKRALADFVYAEAGPFNLAIARIVFFIVALVSLPSRDIVVQYAELPHDLIRAPHNLGALLADLPLNQTWIDVTYAIAAASCVLGILGLWTRMAALLFLVSGFYYLGVPQLYGKVDHYHHLLWFAVVFSLSRSSDALSLGAALRAARRPATAAITASPFGRQYALPLRFMWLLLGLVYLFPGLSKYRFDGLRWLEPQTVGSWMHLIWFQTGYRPPLLRPDDVPGMLTAGAAFTLAFETSFLLLILFKRTRPLAALAGLGFHNSTYYTMRISFWSLQLLYVTLIDWEGISKRFFAKRPRATFAFDGNCGICKRTVAVLQTIVLPGSVRFVNAMDDEAVASGGLDRVDRRRLLEDVHLAVDGEMFVGYEAYRRLAWRSPLLWPALPLLALRPVKSVGNRVYRHVADTRACLIAPSVAPPQERRVRLAPLMVVCSVLLLTLFGIGTAGLRDMNANAAAVEGWPFACYPTFAGVGNDTTTILVLRVQASDGTTRPIDLRQRLSFMSSGRRSGLINSIVSLPGPSERTRALRALVQFVRPRDPHAQRVIVLEQRISIAPDTAGRVLASRQVLAVALQRRQRQI